MSGSGRPPNRRRLTWGCLLGVAACSCSEPPPSRPPNVLLIVVDTLGARHLEPWGADVPTPAIAALAREGVRFETARTSAPWTMPAVASLFTGRMPSRHGVQTLRGRLPDAETTLAEVLATRGYVADGVVSHFLLAPERGYAQGFDRYDSSSVAGHEGITSRQVTDRALAFLRERAAGDRPFFLFVHYFDPHFVYHHHPRFQLVDPAYDGRVRSGMDIWELRDLRPVLRPADVAQLRALYDEEVRFTDFHIGRLLGGLEELGLRESTVVVLTADHGEELMEHGWIGHTRTLYDELLHVPLIVSRPGTFEPASIGAPVSLVDLFPTLLQLTGCPPVEGVEGLSLSPWLTGEGRVEERAVYAEVAFGNPDGGAERNPRAAEKRAHQTAVVWRSNKLVHDLLADRFLLFDLEGDPGETRDLWPDRGRPDHPLLELLGTFEASRTTGTPAPAPLSEEELELLRALGYVR